MRSRVRELMKDLGAIMRERQLVKGSLVSDEAKVKLYAELDARVAQISAELEALDRGLAPTPQGQTGAVQAPQAGQKAR